MKRRSITYGQPLPDDERNRLRDLVLALGEPGALRRLAIAPQTLARCLGGLPVHRGTVEQVRRALADI